MELNSATKYLPRLWSDMVIFDHTLREALLALVLQIASNHFPSVEQDEISEASELAKQFSEISWKIWVIIENQDFERKRQITWTGQMLGDLITIQIKSGNFTNAGEVMKKLVGSPTDILGIPTLDSLKLFLNAAIEQNSGSMCLVSSIMKPKTYFHFEKVHSKAC